MAVEIRMQHPRQHQLRVDMLQPEEGIIKEVFYGTREYIFGYHY
jgi:hypothetical protein